MQNIFTAGIAMALIRQADILNGAAMSFDGIEHTFTLYGIGAGIVVGITMYE